MNLPLYIAQRYLISKKSTNAINFISGISVLGITIGTAALIVVLSVFNGFDGLVKSLYNSFNPDLKLSPVYGKVFVPDENKIRAMLSLNGVEQVTKVIEENALLKYGEKQFIATIKGVDEHYIQVTKVDSSVVRGNFLLKENGINYTVLGSGIEQVLNVNLKSNFEPITIYVPKREQQIVLNPEDAFNRMNVYPSGTFSIQQDFDSKYVFVDLSFAKSLLNYTDEISAIEIKLKPDADKEKTQSAINNLLGQKFSVKNRYQQDEILYKVMNTEKWAIYLILSLILFIAAFNLIGSLTMLVIDKTKDIAILKTMGAEHTLIRKIFLIEGILLSSSGAVLGFVIGILTCFIQIKFKVLKLEGVGSFVVDVYPVAMKISDFILVLATNIIIGIMASWFPAKKAAEERMLFKEE